MPLKKETRSRTSQPPPKQELIGMLRSNAAAIVAFGVRRLGLFGSFAREQQNPESDVDLLVEFVAGQKNFDNFSNLASFLEDLLDRRVELVTMESLSPYIGPRIIEEVEYVDLVA